MVERSLQDQTLNNSARTVIPERILPPSASTILPEKENRNPASVAGFLLKETEQ